MRIQDEMLLGEKVGPYIRPNPASFTRNLDQDRIGRINWDETRCCLCQCFVLRTSDVGWVCKDEPVFLPPRGGLGEACQRWHVAARTAVASRFELELAGDSASGTSRLEQAALLELESTTARAGIVAPDQVNLLFRRHVSVGVLTSRISGGHGARAE